jgi:flagellar FliL protein
VAEEQEAGNAEQSKPDDAVKRVDSAEDAVLSKIESTQKFVYIATLINLLFVVGMGAFIFLKLAPKKNEVDAGQISSGESEHGADAGGEHAGGEHGKEGEKGKDGATVPGQPSFLKESFTVNLADPGRNHFAKVDVDIEIADDFVKEEVSRLIPKIRDFIVIVLSSKTYDQINTVDGKDFLREEIRNKINGYLSRGQIKNVYFSQFIIQ